MLRKLLILATALVMFIPAAAQAKTIVRDGADYSGYANPGSCRITTHAPNLNELHVGCRNSDKAARIRYRFLRDVGGTFAPANVSVHFTRHAGDCSGNNVRWMVPVPRTLRVIVQPGCYIHIVSVTWTQ